MGDSIPLRRAPSPQLLLEELGEYLTDAPECPPIDVYKIAGELQATIVRSSQMREAGTVRLSGLDTYTITLNNNGSAVRRRFTIAHELGHIMLDRMGWRLGEQVRLSNVEGTCNNFASRLLLPRVWLRQDPAIPTDCDLQSVTAVAETARVSTISSFLALAGIHNWDASVSCLKWDACDQRWISFSDICTANIDRKPIPSLATSKALGRPESGMQSGTCVLPFLVGNHQVNLPCDIKSETRRSGRWVTVLVQEI
jgi:hypothetical protein